MASQRNVGSRSSSDALNASMEREYQCDSAISAETREGAAVVNVTSGRLYIVAYLSMSMRAD